MREYRTIWVLIAALVVAGCDSQRGDEGGASRDGGGASDGAAAYDASASADAELPDAAPEGDGGVNEEDAAVECPSVDTLAPFVVGVVHRSEIDSPVEIGFAAGAGSTVHNWTIPALRSLLGAEVSDLSSVSDFGSFFTGLAIDPNAEPPPPPERLEELRAAMEAITVPPRIGFGLYGIEPGSARLHALGRTVCDDAIWLKASALLE